ncbi:MAG: VOC family protein [Myxococcota bacterium]|jgi:catechol 2,3-dioxygenase-like lactoylglutathione lyase family enzyme|nr:VOC family protein [Myxococcota bacterium]
MAIIKAATPQFLVTDLVASIGFYEGLLGFATDFVYEDFYASISRDGASIHLKCAPLLRAERDLRKAGGHIDAFLEVVDLGNLYKELLDRGAPITGPIEERAWNNRDFYLEDPDGYILCFSEGSEGAD